MFVRRALFICAVTTVLASALEVQASAGAQEKTTANPEESDRQALLDRIAILEGRLGHESPTQALTASAPAPARTPAQAGAAAQTSSLNGRVADSQGGVLANAEVTLSVWTPFMPGMKMAPGPSRTTRSTANGTFAFEQVPPGQYVLQVDAPGFGRSSQEITVPSAQSLAVMLEPLQIPGGEAPVRPVTGQAGGDTQALLERIRVLEQRVNDIESSTVLSEPETRVKRIEVYIDKNGNESEQPVPGAKKTVTYQRERVYRRQTINEKIEDALSESEKRSVKLGVSAAIIPQFAVRTRGEPTKADGHAYELANADLFFTANVAQHTLFYADVVGLSGTPPDLEIPSLTLLNGFSARLVRQNELNLREAWLRTELFKQKISLSAGRLDLTNYFDRNAAANDETSQFLSDSLVNNPSLGLAVNGTGFVAVIDPKRSLNFKIGFQQSNPNATSLSDSIYSLAEVGYFANPFRVGEGNYRVWYRVNNSEQRHRAAAGLSFDQRLSPTMTLFGRYGAAQTDTGKDHFYSGGLQFRNHLVVSPGDYWALGYSQSNLISGEREQLAEGYYNFQLTERLKLSFHVTHVLESRTGERKLGYLIPGVRLQASF
jgi:hypothetical protein